MPRRHRGNPGHKVECAGDVVLSGVGTAALRHRDYTIGGYQVIKKWLSYREKPLLGRGLTPDEVRYVTEMARRLAALVALEPALDENYGNITKHAYAWPRA